MKVSRGFAETARRAYWDVLPKSTKCWTSSAGRTWLGWIELIMRQNSSSSNRELYWESQFKYRGDQRWMGERKERVINQMPGTLWWPNNRIRSGAKTLLCHHHQFAAPQTPACISSAVLLCLEIYHRYLYICPNLSTKALRTVQLWCARSIQSFPQPLLARSL